MPLSFQQQLSAHASLLTSPYLTFIPYFSSRLASSILTLTASQKHDLTFFQSQPLTVSRLASASHIPTQPHSSPLPLKVSRLLILLLCCSHALPQEHHTPLLSLFRIFTPWVFMLFTPSFVVCVVYHVGMQ